MPTENDVDETTETERRPKDVRIADFNEKIEAIVYDEEVLRTHDEWEKVDRAWKSERRFFNEYETEESFESTTELAAEVRIAEKAKDLAHDRASRRGYSLALESGLIEEWDGEKLGHAVKAGSVEELSPEWHELRRGGIGGSALGKILGYHWMSKCGHIIMMDEEEHREGIATLAGEKVAPKEKVTYENSGVIYRGHQWEPVLLAWYANNHNVRVGISKDTWRGHLPYQVINVDGLILGDDGEPVLVLVGDARPGRCTDGVHHHQGVPLHVGGDVDVDAVGLPEPQGAQCGGGSCVGNSAVVLRDGVGLGGGCGHQN